MRKAIQMLNAFIFFQVHELDFGSQDPLLKAGKGVV